MAGAISSVFPPPPRKVAARDAWPMVAFLAVFLGGCWALSRFDVVAWTYPEMFVLLAVTPWVWWMHVAGGSGLRGWRAVVALFVRLLVLGTLVAVLAEPRAVKPDDAMSVVFVVDQSQSIRPDAGDAALKYVTGIASGKPEEDEVGLVTFGKSAVVELPPSESFPFEGLAVQVERDGTSLEKALSLGAALLPAEHSGKLVLISDGVETDGNVGALLDELKARNVAVDVLPIAYDFEHEVLVERLELPRQVKTGETYEAVVIAWSQKAGSGELVLQENGETIYNQPVMFGAGKNRYVVPIYLRDPGYYEYTAHLRVAPEADSWAMNNKAVSYLYLRGEGRVLVVVDPEGDTRDAERLVRALREAERDVTVMSSYELPSDPMALLPYDCVMFVNVGAEQVSSPQQQAVKTAVESQGAGFVMVGGANSFGPGGYHRTPIEEVLPVDMDVSQKKVLPKSALAIVLHTCEFADGNTWGKNITKAAIQVLGAQDEVGVLVYDYQGAEKWLFPLTPAGQYAQMAPLINNAQIGDMPDFGRTMQMGYVALMNSDAAAKHMIIISDGDPQPPTPQLLQQYAAAKISISTVAIFPHGAMTQTMQLIAQATGGRFYFPQDPNLLPQIFIKEAKTLKRSMIQNKTFTPDASFPSPILKGIEGMPPLHGYVVTTPKARATTILEVPDTEDEEPILSTWRFGLGKTAAFTSDLSANWAKDWVDWDRYKAFVQQLVVDVSRVGEASDLYMQAYAAGGQGVIVVEDYAEEAGFLEVTAEVKGPPGSAVSEVALQQVAPRRYEGRFPLSGEGRYEITARGVGAAGGGEEGGKERDERTFGGLMVPYSQEFLRLRSNPIVLESIAERTGGKLLTGTEKPEDVFPKDRPVTKHSAPVFPWFLVALSCLVPLDVAVRRVQLDWAVIRGWFGAGAVHQRSEETFSQLLRKKRDVSETLYTAPVKVNEALVAARERQGEVGGEGFAKPQASLMVQEEAKTQQGDGDSMSTTERLLARRKQVREKLDGEEQQP